MFFEWRCPVCGVSDRRVCTACAEHLTVAPTLHIEGLDHVLALLAYDDLSARVVLAGKNGGRRDLLRWMARYLAARVDASLAARAASIDLVTWVPAHPAQRRVRGYDQGEVLARTVGRRLGLRCRPTLRRLSGSSQKGRVRTERLDGPAIRSHRPVKGHVLLIDDVVTTGTSLSRCADALRASGADCIEAAVLAASTKDSVTLRAETVDTIYPG